jgi:hypothetical protein
VTAASRSVRVFEDHCPGDTIVEQGVGHVCHITARSAEFPVFSVRLPRKGSAVRLNLNEFSYRKGSEIFGEGAAITSTRS